MTKKDRCNVQIFSSIEKQTQSCLKYDVNLIEWVLFRYLFNKFKVILLFLYFFIFYDKRKNVKKQSYDELVGCVGHQDTKKEFHFAYFFQTFFFTFLSCQMIV